MFCLDSFRNPWYPILTQNIFHFVTSFLLKSMSKAVAGFRFLPQRHLLFMGNIFFRDVFDSSDVSVYTYTVTTSWTDFLQHTIHFTPYETLAFSHGRAFHFVLKNIFSSPHFQQVSNKCHCSETLWQLSESRNAFKAL